jgi:hypothetical protein
MLKTLSKLFTLKPYGNHLIDGMTELWLFLAAVNIASIALCDAIAWAYFGYTTSQGMAAYITAALAGVIVFTLVGSLDAMFIMHDRSERTNAWRERGAVAARVILVILTFTVTAPFLTQLFFARDIAANIQQRNEATIAAKRQQLVAQANARQLDLESEIAGRGMSGRYGRGPTAAAIQAEVDALQGEIRTFDASVGSPEVLANRYGIDLVREGPATRARVIEELERTPSFVSTQRTIKAFLIFMFLGLICLKLFQPQSVKIYYSARMQAAYARLKAGVFQQRLDPRESAPGSMTPIRFAEWYENDEGVRELAERLKVQEDAVRVLQETLRLDMARLSEDLAATTRSNDELEQQLASVRHELTALNLKIAEEQQALDDFRYDEAGDLPLRDQQLLIVSRHKTVRHLAEHRAAAAPLTASMERLSHRLEAGRSYERQLRETLGAAETEVVEMTKALQNVRQRRLAEIIPASS